MERETTPSQSEWLVMEVFWANETSMVAKEVIEKMQENNASGDIFIVFGGFYKLSGIGCPCYYGSGSKEPIVKIPYESPMDSWRVKLLKLL